MRVLLIRPFLDVFNVLRKVGGNSFPTNLMYLSAFLKREGHAVTLIDYENEPRRMRFLYKDIQEGQFQIIGITSMTPSYPNACFLVSLIKEKFPELPIVFGGVHSTLLPDQVLLENPGVTYVIRGEGEFTFVELLKTLQEGLKGDLKTINGLSFRLENQIFHNADRELIRDLDTLPFPDHTCIIREKYTEPLSPGLYRNKHNQIAEVYTSRGCPFQCKFCSTRLIMGQKCRWRSIENVMQEIDQLVLNQKYNYIFFHDDNFTLQKSRVLHLCNEMKKRKIRWSCITRVDCVDEELIREMKGAGCDKIFLGVESGSLRILQKIEKRITPRQIVNAFQWSRTYKIKTQAYVMVGHPTETVSDVKKTISLIKRINPDFLLVAIFIPFPGTEYYREAVEKGFIKAGNWEKSLFMAGKPAARSDNFTQDELYYWQGKIYAAVILRVQYIWYKVRSLRNFQDIRYYMNAALSFFKFLSQSRGSNP